MGIVGVVLGFMAIRGDFKKKDIYPTAIKFSYGTTQEAVDSSKPIQLLYDVKTDTELDKEQIYTFTVKAEPVDVTTGLRTDSEIQILSGLQIGDTILTSGTLQLRKGSAVKIAILE